LHNGKAVLIMIKRVNKGVHGGQISFPGGEKDVSDIDLQHTAERETFEEVGVKSDSDKIIGPLSSLYIPPSNFFVQPFAACIPNEENYTINRSEVDQLLLIGIDDIDSNLRYSQHIIKRGDEIITAPCFEYQDQIIWGASAMILNEWLEIYNRV
ncbi:MAG TPA: CoA pyrophosphatase, partial [Bacteroidia bacterium]|nr:CoA pyrophosphatase [Bacteroidia bacterium]